MEIAADAGLLDLDFAGAERFGRPDDGVIDRLVEIFHVVRIEADFRSEEFRIEHGIFVARGAVEPGEVAEREWSEVVHSCGGARAPAGLQEARERAGCAGVVAWPRHLLCLDPVPGLPGFQCLVRPACIAPGRAFNSASRTAMRSFMACNSCSIVGGPAGRLTTAGLGAATTR